MKSITDKAEESHVRRLFPTGNVDKEKEGAQTAHRWSLKPLALRLPHTHRLPSLYKPIKPFLMDFVVERPLMAISLLRRTSSTPPRTATLFPQENIRVCVLVPDCSALR